MDCGIPFCHNGCPVNNMIPDWNNLSTATVAAGARPLHSTNNFPEFTGRICPAPCEASCTLNIDDNPVTIKTIECAIVDRGWEEGWIVPVPPAKQTGKTVAVVGSGPAGMACAQQLARAGHAVTLFEKQDRIGGLLRYGIPDFKMEKHLIDRRIDADGGRGGDIPHRHRGRRRRLGRCTLLAGIRRRGADRRCRMAAQPGRHRAGAGRHPLRDGFPDPAEQTRSRRRRDRGRSGRHDQRQGQACRRGRRRRHRLGLHRHLGPPGRGLDHPDRDHAEAAGKENKAMVWPDWPIKLRILARARRRGRARLVGADQARGRRERQASRRWIASASTGNARRMAG